jgi:MtN3 and saliva related transmembrane protein
VPRDAKEVQHALSHLHRISPERVPVTPADIVGYIATVVGTSLMLPQLVQSWRTRQMDDVSFGMIVLYFFNCALWAIYAVMIDARPMVLANSIGFVISIALLAMKMRFRREAKLRAVTGVVEIAP